MHTAYLQVIFQRAKSGRFKRRYFDLSMGTGIGRTESAGDLQEASIGRLVQSTGLRKCYWWIVKGLAREMLRSKT